jgi:uncharacterized repeat protein (TIGR02543 family)
MQSGTISRTPTVGGTSNVNNQTVAGTPSYGSAFGPQVWSQPFSAVVGQAVSYQWKATGGSDDYEVYGYLVEINDAGNCSASTDYGSESTHSILSYGRGTASSWTTTTGNIQADGCFRFRFVAGTYDASGGFAVGADFFIYDAKLGDAQVITFTQPSDVITSSSNQTVSLAVSSNAGATATSDIVLTSSTTSKCTVDSSTKTLTILANQTGTCTIRADSDAIGTYGPATSVYRSLTILAAATAPVSTGGDNVSGNPLVCTTLTVVEGSWANGGASITGTSYQWKRDGVPIIGATSTTYIAQSVDVGKAISFSVTKTNSVGSTTANSNSIIILDGRLSNLTMSAGTLSPAFDGCTYSYSASVSTSALRVTPTVSSASSTVTVEGSAVVSGQASTNISLAVGTNTIEVEVTNGSQTVTTTITVTYAEAPTVTILAPTTVTGTGATLNATVNARGQSTSSITFEISTSATFAVSVSTVTASPSTASGTSDTSISAASPTLTSETTYYVRASATNATGTSTSSTFSFTTPAAPYVSTSAASSLTSTGATVNGSVSGNGDATGTSTTVVFQYSLNPDMSSAVEVSPSSNSTIAGGDQTSYSVSKAITGLQTGSTYYFRLKASNNYGTNYGSVLSFTLTAAPTVTSAVPSSGNITATTAKLTGIVNANASSTTSISFKWGTSSSPSTNLSVTPTTVVGNSDTNVEATLTGLNPSTTYYFFLTATNDSGTTNSTEYSFSTIADPAPTVTLSAPSNSLLNEPFTVTVTFSEVVTGFTKDDLSISGATTGWTAQTAQNVSNGGQIYTVEYRPTGSVSAGTFIINLSANKVLDSRSQANLAASQIQISLTASIVAPDISYSTSSISATQNSSITTLVPSNSGGIISSWSIASPPSLPAGLVFSTTTGEFSGTPTSTISATNFVVTATNSAGSDSVTLSITVSAPPIPDISYTPSSVTVTAGNALSTMTPTNSGVAATSWSISGSLPSGISFNVSTGVISGTPTVTSALTSYTVTATNSDGSDTAVISIEVTSAVSTVPDAPIIGTAIATGLNSATVSFTAPSSNGGSTITTFTATSSPGGITGTLNQSGSGTITILGLQPGTSYSFTVTATNSVGTSSPSSATNLITTESIPLLVRPSSLITFAQNGADNNSYPQSEIKGTTAKLWKNVLTRAGYTFTGWNTKADGTGISYADQVEFKFDADYITLYAQWLLIKTAPVINWASPAAITTATPLSATQLNATANIAGSCAYAPALGALLAAGKQILTCLFTPLDTTKYSSVTKSLEIEVLALPVITWANPDAITNGSALSTTQLNATANMTGSFTYSPAMATVLKPGKQKLSVTFTPSDSRLSPFTKEVEILVLPALTPSAQAITTRSGESGIGAISSTTPEATVSVRSLGVGLENAKATRSEVIVETKPTFSGQTSVIVTIFDEGREIDISLTVKVFPQAPSNVTFSVNSLNSTKVSWSIVNGANSFELKVDEKIVCQTMQTECLITTLLGPKSDIEVYSLGGDNISSDKVRAEYRAPVTSIKFTEINFASDKSTLTKTSRNELDTLVKVVNQAGFTSLIVQGFTDPRGKSLANTKLSSARALATQRYLQRKMPNVNVSIEKSTSKTVSGNANLVGSLKSMRKATISIKA